MSLPAPPIFWIAFPWIWAPRESSLLEWNREDENSWAWLCRACRSGHGKQSLGTRGQLWHGQASPESWQTPEVPTCSPGLPKPSATCSRAPSFLSWCCRRPRVRTLRMRFPSLPCRPVSEAWDSDCVCAAKRAHTSVPRGRLMGGWGSAPSCPLFGVMLGGSFNLLCFHSPSPSSPSQCSVPQLVLPALVPCTLLLNLTTYVPLSWT